MTESKLETKRIWHGAKGNKSSAVSRQSSDQVLSERKNIPRASIDISHLISGRKQAESDAAKLRKHEEALREKYSKSEAKMKKKYEKELQGAQIEAQKV